jgi:hypothetical protein
LSGDGAVNRAARCYFNGGRDEMKIGLWNIAHPEDSDGSALRAEKYNGVRSYLNEQHCDVYVLTEANAALELGGYASLFSEDSPFKNVNRCYDPPNRYHQVAIYSKSPLAREPVAEPINSLLCSADWLGSPLFLYGNVITIKDQWKPDSDKSYSDRLAEQLAALRILRTKRFIACGDFNLRIGRRRSAYQQVDELVQEQGWLWPTKMQDETVQHVIHSPNLAVDVSIDMSVRHSNGKEDRLSDHPFVLVQLKQTEKSATRR